MNQKEYELIARVAKKQQFTPLEFLADLINELEGNYKSFDQSKFYRSLNLTVQEVNIIETMRR